MKRGILFVSMVGALLGAFALGRAGAQEGTGDAKAMEALAKPGPQHADLMKTAGNWTVEQKCWMAGVETTSKAKAIFTPLLGGRFLRQEYEGEFTGQPFHGIGLTGFNNATRKYEDVWICSAGTGVTSMTGTETETGKAWAFAGTCAGPGGKESKMRSVMKKISDDKMFMEMFCDDGTGEKRCMELTYTRSK